MTAESEFLRYSVIKLRQQCEHIEACIARLSPEELWQRGSESQNAAGNLLLHLTGNVRQWILQGVGGAEIQRDRDAEFAARGGADANTMLRDLRDAVEAAAKVIEELPPARLTWVIHIQGHEVSMLEAIYHVVEHFSGHTGQIILLTKAVTGSGLGPGVRLGKALISR
jgi:uncharacterized damage-inducible protein DinB